MFFLKAFSACTKYIYIYQCRFWSWYISWWIVVLPLFGVLSINQYQIQLYLWETVTLIYLEEVERLSELTS